MRRTAQYLASRWPLVLFVVLAWTPALGADSSSKRSLESEIPSTEIDRLRLRAGDGTIMVSPSADEMIRAQVEVTVVRSPDDRRPFGWFLTSRLESPDDLVDAISLSTKVASREATLRLLPVGRSRSTRTIEHWHLQVPQRLFLDLEASSAEVRITDISGGVRLRQGHGKTRIDVPDGELDVRLQVGDLEVRSAIDTWRLVALRSRVGKARLWVDGERVKRRQAPGPGTRITLEGRGAARLELVVEVGDVDLRLDAGPAN